MKIIHMSDIHLDSPLARLDSDRRSVRRAELIRAFENAVEYAVKEGAQAVIIAGDLFDRSKVSAAAKNAVLAAIRKNPQIGFYYLKGNHDKSDFLSGEEDIPSNLYMFDEKWKTYDLGENVSLTGTELTKENSAEIYSSLSIDPGRFNIVVLHGQDAQSVSKDGAEVISIKDLKNKGIDYLALGHIHSFRLENLDLRGTYCYPGCLESRGFDETGEHGFVMLDIHEDGSFETKLISAPIRSAHVCSVDITGLSTTPDITDRVKAELETAGYGSGDLVKVELLGNVDFECEKNIEYIAGIFEGKYFDFKLKDLTKLKVDYGKYRLDESLKGEFIRIVEAEPEISEEDKAEIIRIGIRALMGEGVE